MKQDKLSHDQIAQSVALLHENSVKIELFGEVIEVVPPSVNTIEKACYFLSLIPKVKAESMAELIENATNFEPLYYAIAVMLYGHKHCEQYHKEKRFFGWFEKTTNKKNIDLIVEKIKECTPTDIQIAVTKLLGSQIMADFFGMVSAMMAVLIVETE